MAMYRYYLRLDGGMSEPKSSCSRPRLRAFCPPAGSRGLPEDIPCRSGELLPVRRCVPSLHLNAPHAVLITLFRFPNPWSIGVGVGGGDGDGGDGGGRGWRVETRARLFASRLYLIRASPNYVPNRKADWYSHPGHKATLDCWDAPACEKRRERLAPSFRHPRRLRPLEQSSTYYQDTCRIAAMSDSASNRPSFSGDARPSFQRAGSLSQASEKSQTAQE